jgi:hypothetical protein
MTCLQQAQNVQPLHSDSIHLRIELAKPSHVETQSVREQVGLRSPALTNAG